MAALAVGVLVLAGCGSSGPEAIATTTADPKATPAVTLPPDASTTTKDGDASSGGPADPELEAAVKAYTETTLRGDGEAAYALLSERCRAELTLSNFNEMVDILNTDYGSQIIKSYESVQDGDAATVTYTFTDPTIDQTHERWVREGGAWHNDEC